MKKISGKLLTAVPYIISIILNLALYAAGTVCAVRGIFLYGRLLLWIFVALLAVCLLSSVLGAFLYTRRFKRMAQDEILHYVLSSTQKLHRAEQQAERSLLRLKNGVIAYLGFVILLTLAIPFFFGTADFGAGGSNVLLLFSVYIQADLLHILIAIATAKPDFSQYADSAAYPQLQRLAKRAAQAVGIEGEIRFTFTDDCNAGIQRFGKVISLELGVPLLAVLTEEELYQVFLHEFAHMQDEHIRTARNARMLSVVLESGGSTVNGWANRLLFSLPAAVFSDKFTVFEMASSELNERRADKMMLKKGEVGTAAAGLAKTAMYESYSNEYALLYPKPFFASPTPPTDVCTRDCTRFRRAIKLRKTEWLAILQQELPPRLQSHPTFRQRLETLGNPPFEIELPAEDSPYYAEVLRAAAEVDKTLYDLNCEEYDETRKEEYLAPLAVIEKYEREKKPLSAAEARPIVEAYLELHRFAEAQAICEDILSRAKNDTEAAHASFALGTLLLMRYDARGAAYIQRAIDANEENFAEAGFEQLGKFYAKMGMQKELEENRKRVDAYLHTYEQREAIAELSRKDTLRLVPQDAERRAQIAHIASLCGETVQKIYLLRKDVTDSLYTYAYILQFSDGTDEAQQDKVVTAVFNYLDTEDDQYALFVYNKSYEKICKAVGDCCVYEK